MDKMPQFMSQNYFDLIERKGLQQLIGQNDATSLSPAHKKSSWTIAHPARLHQKEVTRGDMKLIQQSAKTPGYFALRQRRHLEQQRKLPQRARTCHEKREKKLGQRGPRPPGLRLDNYKERDRLDKEQHFYETYQQRFGTHAQPIPHSNRLVPAIATWN